MKDANRTPHPNDERSSANNCNGQIRQFYAGKHVLLTGCTGFLGTVAVEKILRTCKEISKLYIMIRQKKGKSVEERINHFFKNDIFDKLREMNPNFMEKIEVIYGDLEKEDLGLSPEDRRRLVENVNEQIPWVGNKNGPVVLSLAVMNGYLHALYWYEHVTIDAIPVDMTINGLLAAIWDFVVNR
ncbi:Fatty acyl-CoA reductase 1 [Eufriesea mexicana]|uniref:Fatty acyl-CoA reductase n=1 Tax=Eufriesea mexicana TaxID=516756 RepID=A0A310SAG5_9HYME|nr:Fatty acyl-CoA reductase 1 [Eufriesea mexicana]